MVMVIQMRILIFKIATIQPQLTVQLTFFTFNSRKVANRDYIHQHCSQVTGIQEIFH
jgi:hypothetical protein